MKILQKNRSEGINNNDNSAFPFVTFKVQKPIFGGVGGEGGVNSNRKEDLLTNIWRK